MSNPVVVVMAHPDDEVLGCGGTIAKLAKSGRQVHILLVADGETARSDDDAADKGAKMAARERSAEQACKVLGASSVDHLGFADNRLDEMVLLDIVKPIEDFIKTNRPSTVFTHHAGDVNIDHRIVHDAVITACRQQPGFSVEELFFCEVPSSTEWRPPNSGKRFAPNWFFDITEELSTKTRALQAYDSELRPFPHPRSIKAVECLANWRGATVGVAAAEAFVLGRKVSRGI